MVGSTGIAYDREGRDQWMGLSSIRSSNNSSWQSQMKRATSEFLPYSILAVLRGQRERGNQRELDYNRKAKDSKILEVDISTCS